MGKAHYHVVEPIMHRQPFSFILEIPELVGPGIAEQGGRGRLHSTWPFVSSKQRVQVATETGCMSYLTYGYCHGTLWTNLVGEAAG